MQPGALCLPLGKPAVLTGDGSKTKFAVDLGNLRLGGEAETIFDARALTVAVNNTTDQAIAANGIEAFFADGQVGGAAITYTATNAAIDAGKTGTAFVPITSGKLADLSLQVTFSTAPASGKTASVRVAVEGPGGPTPLAAASALSASSVTPSDSTTFAATKGLYVGGSGNVAVTMADGTSATFTAVSTGVVLPLSVTAVKSTNTTATDIVALY